MTDALDWSARGWSVDDVESAVQELSDKARDSVKLISLNRNHLSLIPSCLRTFSSLSFLMLDQNPLVDVTNMGDFTTLTSLMLINSQLSELPPSIGNLTKLEALYLQNNGLRKLPGSLMNLTNLKT